MGLELRRVFSKAAGYKVNKGKPIVFPHISDGQLEIEILRSTTYNSTPNMKCLGLNHKFSLKKKEWIS